MRRLGLPICALGGILLWWLGAPGPAARRLPPVHGAEATRDAVSYAEASDLPAAGASPGGPGARREAGPVLEGTVIDPDGRGVEGVMLSAHFARHGNSSYPHNLGFETCRTDGSGRFRLDVPSAAGWANLWIGAPGWVQPARRRVGPGGTTIGDSVPADAGALGLVRKGRWPRQKIVLERGVPVEGVVETAQGVRLPDVRVEATWGAGPGQWGVGHTDERGSFSIIVPADAVLVARAYPGEWFIPDDRPSLPWEALAPRFAEVLKQDAEASVGPIAPGTSDVRMVLHDIVPLRVRVRGPEGPITGHVTVRVRDLTRPARGVLVYEPYARDGELEYEIPRVVPGAYEIEVLPHGEWLPACVVATVPGESVDVRLAPGLSIEGLLEGEDLKDFRTTWTGPCNEGWRTLRTESAEFVFRAVGEGVGDLYARREGDPRYALVTGCRPGRGVVRLTLSEGRTIRGRVEIPEGFDPAALAVRAVRGLLDQYARVCPDGAFSIVGLPPGLFRVECVTRGWSRDGLVDNWTHDANDDVPAGAEGVRLRVRLPATDPDRGS